MTRPVFIDASAVYARYVENDQHYDACLAAFALVQHPARQATLTSAIISEAFTLLRARGAEAAAFRFLDDVRNSGFSIIHVEPPDHLHAEDILRRYRDKAFSYCDALSFAVMERLGVEEAIAYDRHFRDYGQFKLL